MKRPITLACLLVVFCLNFASAQIDPRLTGTTMHRGGKPSTRLPDRLTVGLRVKSTTGCRSIDGRPTAGVPMATEGKDGAVWVDLQDGPLSMAPMAVPVLVETPGKKSIWLRAKVGRRSLVFWGVDDFARRAVMTPAEKDKPDDTWRWHRLTNHTMKRGETMLHLRRHAGPIEVDRLAVLPADAEAPEGPGGQPFETRPRKAVLVTRTVTLPAVTRWLSASVDLSGDAEVSWSASSDGGKTWRPMKGNTFDGLDLPTDPAAVTLQAEITPKPDQSVTIGAVTMDVAPDAKAWAVVGNDYMQVMVDRRTGRLVRLRDLKHRRDILWTDAATGLFSIDLKQKGKARWLRYSDTGAQLVKLVEGRRGTDHEQAEGLGPGVAEQVAGAEAKPARLVGVRTRDGRIEMTWTVESDVTVTTAIALDETAQATWTIDVHNNHPELDVIQVEFPRFRDVRIGARGDDDRQVRFQTFDQDSNHPGTRPVRDATYPGGCAMPWESIYDERGGFSRISRDRDAVNLAFESSTGSVFGDVVSVTTRKLDRIAAGGGKRTYDYAVAVHPGAWHWAADRYREWALGHFVRPVYPEWFADSDGFYFHGQMNHGTRFVDYPEVARRALRVGLKHVQVWGQFTDTKYGCCGPYWQPSPRYGTLEEFVQGVAASRELGVRMGFYFLHDRVDLYHAKGSHIYGFINKKEYPEGTEFPTDEMFRRLQWVDDPAGKQFAYPLDEAAWADYRKRVAAHQADPKKNREPRRWHPVDISDPVWWEYIRHWAVDKYAGQWGAAGIYNDVLATGSARVSYDPRKDHHGTATAGVGKMGIARTVAESARKQGREEFFHLCEGAGDIVAQWCAPANMGIYRFKTELFRYTWPDAVVFEGTAGQGSRNLQRVRLAAWVNGNRFDTRQPNNEMARIIAARAAVRNWIYRARYLEQLGIRQSPVHARLFRRVEDDYDGATVTLAYNRFDEQADTSSVRGRVVLESSRVGEVRRGVLIGHHGLMQPLELTHEKDTISFAGPVEPFAAAVLVSRASLPDGLVVLPVVDRVPRVEAVEVKLANLTDAPLSGRVVPREFGSYDTPQPKPYRCQPGQVTVVRFELKGGHGTFARVGFDIEVGPRVVKRAEVSIFPLVEDPSYEQHGQEAQRVAEGKRSLRIDAKQGYNAHVPSLYPEPGRRYRLRVKAFRPKGSRGSRFIRLVQNVDSGQDNRTLARPKTSDAWETLEIVFETPPVFIDHRVYMYNNNSTGPMWYDDMTLEDLGPAGKE